nr:hypothetical protein [Angustibacter aerolatus]
MGALRPPRPVADLVAADPPRRVQHRAPGRGQHGTGARPAGRRRPVRGRRGRRARPHLVVDRARRAGHDAAAPRGAGGRRGCATTLVVEGPAPVVLAYLPLAGWALRRLVRP